MLMSRCRPALFPLSLLVGLTLLAREWGGSPAGSFLGWDAVGAAAAAEEEDYSQELPRIPPTSPADALKTFRTLPGFTIEQVAAEPLLHSPVAVAYDGVGRAFVVEMIDYSEQDKEFLGSVRLLEDLNGDGVFDKSTLFADKLSWPTAIACYDGGVFVGAAPDIFYLKDTTGDGQADQRDVVFTGFGRSNVQGLFNSFHWGFDNRIHGAVSSSGAQVKRPGDDATAPVSLNGRDFSFDPRKLDIRPESGGAQHGMCFDDFGRKFVCSNSDHIQLVMYEDRYLARNRSLSGPGPRVSIAADGPQAEVFRISAVEPWRIVRTRLRVSGKVPGPVEGGGRAAGYFTGATGVMLYRGDAWPAEYRGQAFIGDVGSNIVHRKVLKPQGMGLVAERVDDKVEFLASSDTWFRPAQFVNAPDGCLHVIDVCRETIEHPASLPPMIKKHLDLTSGRDRGRLYRVRPQGYQSPEIPRLAELKTAALIPYLAHRNAWHRVTAQRLLWERADRTVAPALADLAKTTPLAEGRLHALCTLAGLGLLESGHLIPALADAHPGVRRNAIRLAEPLLSDSVELRQKVAALAADEDPLVRYQLAFTLGEFAGDSRLDGLVRVLVRDGADRWVRLACLSSLSEGAGDVLTRLVAQEGFLRQPAAGPVLTELTQLIGTQARPGDVSAVLTALDKLPAESKELAGKLVATLSEALVKANSPLRERITADTGKAKELLRELLQTAQTVAIDASRPEQERADATRTLGLGEYAASGPILAQLIDSRQPQSVQLAAVASLGRFRNPEIGSLLVETWPSFGPKLRPVALETIFSRPEWLVPFLEAIQKEDIPASDVEPGRFRLLEAHADQGVRKLVENLKSKVAVSKRADVLADYAPALQLEGRADEGRKHFQKVCSVCHKLEGQGHEIGPNLAAIQNRGAEAILVNLMDPNREVNPQYVNYILQNKAGKSITGLIAAETANSVTLRRQENQQDTVLRDDIETLRSSGLSIMPEGLEKNLDRQAVADLIAYLLSIK
jgi:putative membrane-bound dehydrogenase-like protein